MDDLTEKINSILGDPQMMEQIKGLSGLFASESDNSQKESEEENIKKEGNNNSFDPSILPVDTMQIIMKIIPLLSSINTDDNSTRLLHALKPFLADERKSKLDEAIKIMHLMKVLPIIKGSGIF